MNLAWLRPMYVVCRSSSNSRRYVTPYSQRAVHHERVHIAESWVKKCARKTANRRKAELLPQVNRPQISADDKVELDGTEAVSSRALQRMSAHRSRHSATRGLRRRHVAAVRQG